MRPTGIDPLTWLIARLPWMMFRPAFRTASCELINFLSTLELRSSEDTAISHPSPR